MNINSDTVEKVFNQLMEKAEPAVREGLVQGVGYIKLHAILWVIVSPLLIGVIGFILSKLIGLYKTLNDDCDKEFPASLCFVSIVVLSIIEIVFTICYLANLSTAIATYYYPIGSLIIKSLH